MSAKSAVLMVLMLGIGVLMNVLFRLMPTADSRREKLPKRQAPSARGQTGGQDGTAQRDDN